VLEKHVHVIHDSINLFIIILLVIVLSLLLFLNAYSFSVIYFDRLCSVSAFQKKVKMAETSLHQYYSLTAVRETNIHLKDWMRYNLILTMMYPLYESFHMCYSCVYGIQYWPSDRWLTGSESWDRFILTLSCSSKTHYHINFTSKMPNHKQNNSEIDLQYNVVRSGH
jgi:hypothetical protein